MTFISLFSKKMIPVKTQYKTLKGKLLAIVDAYKIWHYYLNDCKPEILVLIQYNNLYYFMDIVNPSSRQVC